MRLYLGQGRGGRRLLRDSAAATLPSAAHVKYSDHTVDVKNLGMISATGCDQFVDRQCQPLRLQQFLQTGLGVLVVGASRVGNTLIEQIAHAVAASLPTAVEVDGGDQGLERIGKNGIAPETATLELARAKSQLIAKFQISRHASQRWFAHQARTQPRELTFVCLRETFVQHLGDEQVDQRVAEELQAFVVARADTAVAQRTLVQRDIAKNMGELCGQGSVSGAVRQIDGFVEMHQQVDVVDEWNPYVIGTSQTVLTVFCN